MSYLALYRKYRPEKFDDVVGQNHIVKILENSILYDKLSHAYLFSGPRGTGKTTIAKVIAKIINCHNKNGINPCGECPSCIAFANKNNPDIIEIDAASNNGVDEIREIRDKANLSPSLSKYKIYIVDEVHMLSSGAFNALLKTLEEPPSHVIFILATTEFYKVPETIVSRCQCFEFERLNKEYIKSKLKEIANSENIIAEEEVFSLIASYSDGGLRDAINMLDKLSCFAKDITTADFYELRGLIKREDFEYIIANIFSENINEVLIKLEEISKQGKNITLLAEELLVYLKDSLVELSIKKEALEKLESLYNMVEITNDIIINMKRSTNPRVILEIGLLKLINITSVNNVNITKVDVIETNEIVKRETVKEENVLKKQDDIVKEIPNNFQDIKLEDNMTEKEEDIDPLGVNEPLKELKKETEKDELSILLEENHKIRIRNALTLADKKILSDMKIRWVNLNDYLYNKEFSSVVSYLMDGTLRVAGTKDVIISVPYEAVATNAKKNLDKIELLLNLISSKYYKIAFVLDEEWEIIKKQYIADKNNNIIYEYQEEKEIDYDIIEATTGQKKELSETINDAISLFGNDLVEIK